MKMVEQVVEKNYHYTGGLIVGWFKAA